MQTPVCLYLSHFVCKRLRAVRPASCPRLFCANGISRWLPRPPGGGPASGAASPGSPGHPTGGAAVVCPADAGVRGGLARGWRNPSPGRVPKISSPEGTSQRPQNDCTNICSGVVTSQVLSRAPVYTWDGTGAIQPCPPAASRFRQRRSGERPLLFLRRRGGRGFWGRTRDPDTGMGGGSLL